MQPSQGCSHAEQGSPVRTHPDLCPSRKNSLSCRVVREGKRKGPEVYRVRQGTFGKISLLEKRGDLQEVVLIGFVKKGGKQRR